MRSKKSLAASTYTSLSDLLLFRFSWQLDVSLSRYRRCSTTVTKGLACPKARPVRKWCHTLYACVFCFTLKCRMKSNCATYMWPEIEFLARQPKSEFPWITHRYLIRSDFCDVTTPISRDEMERCTNLRVEDVHYWRDRCHKKLV
jgi:hypothetical protein